MYRTPRSVAKALVLLAGLLGALAAPLAQAEARAEEGAEEIDWMALVPAGWEPEAPDMSSFFHGGSGPSTGQSADAPVVDALHDRRVILEGWLVPLEMERAERYHEFLLVPYFGACIHVPPPPANQVVHLFLEEGVSQDEVFEPQRVTGRLRVDASITEMAAAGYRMEDATATVAQW